MNSSSSSPLLVLDKITRTFQQGKTELQILRGVSLTLRPGELTALVGPSGCGKSTLLQIAGLLDHPTTGNLQISGHDCGGLSDQDRTRFRRRDVGFIYQFHHLLPEFTALENIMLPQMIEGAAQNEAKERARDLLGRLGLESRASHRPSKLSGGEQQRVAVLRALANRPKLLLADEPTGNLDEATSEKVFTELLDLVRAQNMGALIATHDKGLARRMDRIFVLHNGIVTEEKDL